MTGIAQEGKPMRLTTQKYIANVSGGVGPKPKPLKERRFGEADGACK
jgi:hypothetical protein